MSVSELLDRKPRLKYNADALPLNMYEREQPMGEKSLFETHPAADLDANQLEETSEL